MPSLFSEDTSLWDIAVYVFGWFYEIINAVIPFSLPKILGVIGVVILVLVINEKRANKKVLEQREKAAYRKMFAKKNLNKNNDEPPPIPNGGFDSEN
jgi:hypothetical protein